MEREFESRFPLHMYFCAVPLASSMPDFTAPSRTAAALVLFCRRPQLGTGKRRLARSLGETRALGVAEALLECAVEDLAAWPGHRVIAPARGEDAAWAEGLVAGPKLLAPQGEGSFGRRLNTVDAAVRRQGIERILYIGSDAPSLEPGDFLAAAELLARTEVVLMPSADGGVTLMGSRVPWPDLTALPWSEPDLGAALGRLCADCGLGVARMRASYDVDEVSDLQKALAALAGDSRAARRRLRELLVSIPGSAGWSGAPDTGAAEADPAAARDSA